MNRCTNKVFPERDRCCGCGLCAACCPVRAISMREDAEGFLYPEIDPKRCIRCGRCRTGCPFDPNRRRVPPGVPPTSVWGARLTNGKELAKSQSGGVFAALAGAVLREGGVVYGAALAGCRGPVFHRRVDSPDALESLLGSKYVQSVLSSDLYRELRRDVEDGRFVLFSGTPCQAAAVASLWPHGRPSNLVVCDLICHSVASPRFWRDYASQMQRRMGVRFSVARFRDKTLAGWRRMVESFTAEDGRIVTGRLFSKLFSTHLLFRPSCSRCPFATPFRGADITLGDLWGVERIRPDWDADDLGASLALIRTPIGETWFRRASAALECFPVPSAQENQAQLRAPVPQPRGRWMFWLGYRLFGLSWARMTVFLFRVRAAVLRRIGKEAR